MTGVMGRMKGWDISNLRNHSIALFTPFTASSPLPRGIPNPKPKEEFL